MFWHFSRTPLVSVSNVCWNGGMSLIYVDAELVHYFYLCFSATHRIWDSNVPYEAPVARIRWKSKPKMYTPSREIISIVYPQAWSTENLRLQLRLAFEAIAVVNVCRYKVRTFLREMLFTDAGTHQYTSRDRLILEYAMVAILKCLTKNEIGVPGKLRYFVSSHSPSFCNCTVRSICCFATDNSFFEN